MLYFIITKYSADWGHIIFKCSVTNKLVTIKPQNNKNIILTNMIYITYSWFLWWSLSLMFTAIVVTQVLLHHSHYGTVRYNSTHPLSCVTIFTPKLIWNKLSCSLLIFFNFVIVKFWCGCQTEQLYSELGLTSEM